MMNSQSNILRQFIAKNVARTAAVIGVAPTSTNLAAGEIVVTNEAGVVVNAAPTGGKFRLAYLSDRGDVVWSDVIDASTITNYIGKLSAAATEKITYIGYTGSTGSIEVNNSTTYVARILLLPSVAADFAQQKVKHMVYKSDIAATQEEIATGLVQNLSNNYQINKEPEIKAERVLNSAGVEALGAADTFVGVRGQSTITIVETGGVLPYLFAVGDYVRLGTATTDPVYKITATTVTVADGGVLTLDTPLQTSISATGAGLVEYITAALAAASNFGVKLTSLARNFKVGLLPYDKFDFNTTLTEGFGATTVTTSQETSFGTGTYEQVSEAEYVNQSVIHSVYYGTMDSEIYSKLRDAVSGQFYSVLSFSHVTKTVDGLGSSVNLPKKVIIYMACGTTAAAAVTGTALVGGAGSDILTRLDALAALGVGNSAQIANV